MKPNQSFAEYIHNRGTNLTRMRLEWEKLRQTQLWAADAEVFFEYMGLRIGDVQPIQAEGWVHGQSKVAVIGPYKYQCEGLFDPESGTRYIAFHQCPVTGKPDQKLSILVTRLEDRLSKVSSVHTNQVIDDKICHSPQELVREIALRMTERPELYAKARSAWKTRFIAENELPPLIAAGKIKTRRPGFVSDDTEPQTGGFKKRIAPTPQGNVLASAADKNLGTIDPYKRRWF